MEEYTVKVFKNRTEWYQNDHLHRLNGPASEHTDGAKFYFQNGKLHREDGPAAEHASGNKFYYQNGKLHREDGPAVEYNNGDKEYWIDDIELSEQRFFAQQNPCKEKIITVDGKDYKLVPA